MRSRIATGAAIGLLAALSVAAGLSAQDKPAAQEKPEPEQPGSAVKFKTLLNFNNTNGSVATDALVQGTDGNLYGTTASGGLYDQGTVFKITPQGTLTTLYNFCAQTNCPDGNDPHEALTLGTDGNFYGTTFAGGAYGQSVGCGGAACGVVFKITPAGAMTTLYSFCAQPGCADGIAPGVLVQGNDGNFYGTTGRAGSQNCVNGCGTVFKITPTGAFTTLYQFTGQDGGGYSPDLFEQLVQGTDGNFYGTTAYGGSGTGCLGSCGTVFRITPEGELTTLYNFQGGPGESEGGGQLIQAADGNFYGTAGGGYFNSNCLYGCGTIFKMTPEGVVTTLLRLDGKDGYGPVGLIQATDGNFYVVTQAGGLYNNNGTISELTPEGAVRVLHSFNGNSGGSVPFAGVVQATNGTFYGDTDSSFTGYGVIYSLSVGLGPFVESVPPAGKVGTTVKILGNNLKFATGVTFNGVAASFTVQSSTYMKATVPPGATTGPIEVTLPNGTLTSNVNFQVAP